MSSTSKLPVAIPDGTDALDSVESLGGKDWEWTLID
jgi:hypothetical protein